MSAGSRARVQMAWTNLNLSPQAVSNGLSHGHPILGTKARGSRIREHGGKDSGPVKSHRPWFPLQESPPSDASYFLGIHWVLVLPLLPQGSLS